MSINYYLFMQELKPLSDAEVLECWKNVCEKIRACQKQKSIDRDLIDFQSAVADEIQHRNLGNV